MPLDNPNPETGGGAPSLSRTAIGQRFTGVMCEFPVRRQRKKQDGTPIFKDSGKPSNELVVTMLTINSTMPVGKVGEHRVPAPGEVVRTFINGKTYSQWIDAEKELGHSMRVGDVVEMTVDIGQAYDEKTPSGPQLTTQAECDAVPRGRTLGYYGSLMLRHADASEASWDAKACAHYNDSQRPVESGVDDAPEPPF